MITGQIASPEDAAAFTQDVADKWRQANRLLLEQYKQWAAQKAEAGSVGPARALGCACCMIDHPALRGILPVLQIPFRGAGVEQVVDDDSLRAEVDFCIAAGVDGLVVPALASEFIVLAPEERQGVVATVIDQTGQRVPVVANVAAASLQEAVSYATHAREVGAAAVMALPPYVRRPGPDGVFAYYVVHRPSRALCPPSSTMPLPHLG